MDRLRVVAPFAGFVTLRHTDVGQWIDEGGPVATLTRLDEVEVRVQVEEDVIGQIRIGQQVDIRCRCVGSSKCIEGAIRAVVPRADWRLGSRSFPVIVRLPNTIEARQPRLKEGMVARITFHGAPREVLLIDKDAIDRSTGRSVVYLVQPDSLVRAIEVQEGMSQGQWLKSAGHCKQVIGW